MSGEFIEFFNELIFGSGAIFGFLIINLFLLIMVLKLKYTSMITAPVSVLVIIYYWQNIAVSSNFMWLSFFMFLSILLQLSIELKR